MDTGKADSGKSRRSTRTANTATIGASASKATSSKSKAVSNGHDPLTANASSDVRDELKNAVSDVTNANENVGSTNSNINVKSEPGAKRKRATGAKNKNKESLQGDVDTNGPNSSQTPNAMEIENNTGFKHNEHDGTASAVPMATPENEDAMQVSRQGSVAKEPIDAGDENSDELLDESDLAEEFEWDYDDDIPGEEEEEQQQQQEQGDDDDDENKKDAEQGQEGPTTKIDNGEASKTNGMLSLEEEFRRDLATLQLQEASWPLVDYSELGHASKSSSTQTGGAEIAKQYDTLRDNLPLSLSACVFVRTHETRLDRFSAIISGPENTPYAHGLFLFEFSLPASFPKDPPKAQLLTTGGGRVRFNPNLYTCGKVCLSLLGTWTGRDASERWNRRSTLLQLLVSIQSLILVEEPFYNEPGYENHTNDLGYQMRSLKMNSILKKYVVKFAIIEMLRKPPEHFKEAVLEYFRKKKDIILLEVSKWIKESLPFANQQGTNIGPQDFNYAGQILSNALIDHNEGVYLTQKDLDRLIDTFVECGIF